jgi:hypothetical protein
MSIIQIGMDTDKVERDITKAYIIKLTDRISELESKLAGSKYTVDLFCVKYKELEKERKWIDVIKELPKTTMSVLVTNGAKVGELTYVKYVNGTGKWAGNNEDITAWMLKPKSPEALKDQE